MNILNKISKVGIAVCVIGIMLTIINWFTGCINTKIVNSGGSAICLCGFCMALAVFINVSKKDIRGQNL